MSDANETPGITMRRVGLSFEVLVLLCASLGLFLASLAMPMSNAQGKDGIREGWGYLSDHVQPIFRGQSSKTAILISVSYLALPMGFVLSLVHTRLGFVFGAISLPLGFALLVTDGLYVKDRRTNDEFLAWAIPCVLGASVAMVAASLLAERRKPTFTPT